MDKLVERQPPGRGSLVAAPALAVQFFLIPLAVVAVTAAIYVGFRTLLADDRTPQEYLVELRHGGTERQWPAAYELSQLMADPKVRADRRLAPELVKAYEEAKDGDPRVRRYLALAIGRLDPPLPQEAIVALTHSLEEPDKPWTPDWFSKLNGWSATDGSEARITAIWALGSSGDASVVPRLQPLYYSTDAGIRKMVAYALGALPGDTQIVTLRTALEDPVADVRWNAAIALSRHCNREGVALLKQILDRAYLSESFAGAAQAGADIDPAG